MLFALICTDKPNSLSVRMDNRPAHVDYLNALGDALKGAGPFLDADGNPAGSLLLIEADDQSAINAIADGDPYAKAGLFQSVDIRPWAWLISNPYEAG